MTGYGIQMGLLHTVGALQHFKILFKGNICICVHISTDMVNVWWGIMLYFSTLGRRIHWIDCEHLCIKHFTALNKIQHLQLDEYVGRYLSWDEQGWSLLN